MRIGVDIRPLMDREYSGVSWYTLDLLSEILRQDKANEYILYYNSGRDISSRISELGFRTSDNVKIIATRYPNKIFNYFLQKICRWPKLDMIASRSNPPFKGGDRAGSAGGGLDIFWMPHLNFASFSKNCLKTLTVHDLSFLVFPEFFSARKNIWHKLMGVKKMIADADRIIAISENTKRDIVKIVGIPEEKISVIPSGVGEEFRPLRGSPETETAAEQAVDDNLKKIKAKYGLPEKFILNIGTIEPRKNISGLVEAFDVAAESPALKDYFLVIVGGRGWKNKEAYRAINLAKNKDKIRVIGYIKKNERVYFYNLAKIFCYPSFYEGFGLPILEAMASGVPVITSAVSAMPEVAGAAAVYVDPNDVATISEAIKQLAGDEALRRELIARGVEQAKKFSWERTAEKYLEIFTDFCHSERNKAQ